MKKSKLLLAAGILGTCYLLYLVVYFAGDLIAPSSATDVIASGLATALVTPHMVCVGVAVVFNWLGWALKAPWAGAGGGHPVRCVHGLHVSLCPVCRAANDFLLCCLCKNEAQPDKARHEDWLLAEGQAVRARVPAPGASARCGRLCSASRRGAPRNGDPHRRLAVHPHRLAADIRVSYESANGRREHASPLREACSCLPNLSMRVWEHKPPVPGAGLMTGAACQFRYSSSNAPV